MTEGEKPSKQVGSGCFWLILLGIFGVGMLMVGGKVAKEHGTESRAAAVSAGQWRDNVDVGISKALAKGGAKGCGEYRYLSVDGNSEYLVECFDGHRKRYYQVWPKIESIVGPYDQPPTN